MVKGKRRSYTQEYKEEAVKLVPEHLYGQGGSMKTTLPPTRITYTLSSKKSGLDIGVHCQH